MNVSFGLLLGNYIQMARIWGEGAREKEREREREIYIYTYIYIYL